MEENSLRMKESAISPEYMIQRIQSRPCRTALHKPTIQKRSIMKTTMQVHTWRNWKTTATLIALTALALIVTGAAKPTKSDSIRLCVTFDDAPDDKMRSDGGAYCDSAAGDPDTGVVNAEIMTVNSIPGKFVFGQRTGRGVYVDVETEVEDLAGGHGPQRFYRAVQTQ
jgi:hypothetical protein